MLVGLPAAFFGVAALVFYWDALDGELRAENPAAGVSYGVPADWRSSVLVLPIGGGQWGGLIEGGQTSCGDTQLVSGQVMSSPYPRSGETATATAAVESAIPAQLMRATMGIAELPSDTAHATYGPARPVMIDGVAGARLDITVRGNVPECPPADPDESKTHVVLAVPATDSSGREIMTMISIAAEDPESIVGAVQLETP